MKKSPALHVFGWTLGLAWLVVGPHMASGQGLALRDPEIEIGLEDGPEEYTFGFIKDVELDSRGNIYVLDTRPYRIARYASDGTFLEDIGRSGAGPGEFRDPVDMAIDQRGRLHVLDPGNGRISIYDVSGEAAQYVESQRMPLLLSKICVAGSRRFGLHARGELLIHELDSKGRPVRSFGEPVEPDPQLARGAGAQIDVLRGQLSLGGSLWCDSETDRLLFLTQHGHVRMYRLDGRLIWQTDLENVRRSEIRLVDGMCCGYGRNRASGTRQSSVVAIAHGSLLRVSLAESFFTPALEYGYEVRTLRASDGAELAVESTPSIIAAARNGVVIGYAFAPYPRILIW